MSKTYLFAPEIGTVLRPHGYKKHGHVWLRHSAIGFTFVHLQRAYGNQYYVNLGAFVSEAHPDAPSVPRLPYMVHIDIYGRLESLTDQGARLLAALALDSATRYTTIMGTDDRIRIVGHELQERGIPALRQWETLEGIADFLGAIVSKGFSVAALLRDVLAKNGYDIPETELTAAPVLDSGLNTSPRIV